MKPSDPHRKLVEGYRRKCPDGWASGPDDGYFFQNLASHLRESRQLATLRSLLLDVRWLEAKLRATDLPSLLADFELAGSDPDLVSVKDTLRLSAHALSDDPSALAGQLVGRLTGAAIDFPDALQGINARGSTLIPYGNTLFRSGGALIASFSRHDSWLTALAVNPDGTVAASASGNTVLLWEPYTGRLLGELVGHYSTVTDLAFHPTAEVSFRHRRMARYECGTWKIGERLSPSADIQTKCERCL
jgi:WD40 repeat protein